MLLKKMLDPRYYVVRRRQILPYVCGRLDHALASLGVPASGNYRRLAALRDAHRGRRAFFIGNGPSLRVEDLDALQGEFTFASNKIYLAFGQTRWRPTYYTVCDALVAENNRDEILRQELRKIFSVHVKPYFRGARDILFMTERATPHRGGRPAPQFCGDILGGAGGGGTVLFAQLQLGFFMGIREAILIGVDFSFHTPQPTGGDSFSGKVVVGQGEVNHFHRDYRKPGEKWTVPQLDLQRLAFAEARRAFEGAGGSIVNASRRSELDVLPRVLFEDVMARK